MRYHTWRTRTLLALIAVLAIALITAGLLPTFHWIHRPFPGFFVHENLTVGPFFLPAWTGSVAGVKSLDRIVSVNGSPVSKRTDFYAIIRSAPAGSAVRYEVARTGKRLSITVRSMDLSFHDWLLTFGIYMIIGLAFLFIGAAPYYLRASSPAALPLCFMGLAVFIWFEVTFDFMTDGLVPREFRLFGLTLTPSAGVHLAFLLRSGKSLWRARPLWLFGLYGVAVSLAVVCSATFFAPGEVWEHVFQACYLYTCLGAIAFLCIIGGALRIHDSDVERSRLRVMFVGALFGFFIPTLATVLTSSFGWAIPYNLALVPTVFFPLSVAYALVKYSLFDLGNTLKAALSRIALAALLLVIYLVIGVVLEAFTGIYKNDPLVPLFFAVVVVLVFNPLLSRIEKLVDRYIYRQEYDAAAVQRDISLFLRTLAPPRALAEGFVQMIAENIGTENARIIYLPRDSAQPITAGEAPAESVQRSVTAIRELREENFGRYSHGLSRMQIRGDPELAGRRDALARILGQFGSELLIPLVFERQVRGFLSLGIKKSRQEYSAEDLRLLGTLGDQLALSLENGRLYDESLKAYRQAEATNQKLLEMDRVKKEFVQNICHELRTPVSTIIGFTEVLLEPNLQSDSHNILRRLVENARDLSSLMDSLMNFSRVESGASVKLELVKVHEIVGAVELMARRLIRERPIQFSTFVEPSVAIIRGDAQNLQQIFTQLVTNAIKFTREGRVEVRVSSGTDGARQVCEISVADTGIGIKREDQKIIFDEFRQLDGSATRHHGGTGVGLALCRKLVVALGGTIRVSSEPQEGSVFTVTLPLASAEPDEQNGWNRDALNIGFALGGAQ